LADSTRLFDPYRYVRAADMAVADGDPDRAINLIEEAYMAFDLCLAGCTHARCRDEVANGKKKAFSRSTLMHAKVMPPLRRAFDRSRRTCRSPNRRTR
jgi:hypothetical protein